MLQNYIRGQVPVLQELMQLNYEHVPRQGSSDRDCMAPLDNVFQGLITVMVGEKKNGEKC